MALQGNLDTFALPDVLRLLASTKKSGCLRVGGTRGTGSVWVDEGRVVAAEATGTPPPCTPLDVIFELLRYSDGTFAFESDPPPAPLEESLDLEDLLGEVEGLSEEWSAIEAVVPSMEHWIALAEELPADEVTLDAAAWRTVISVGSGAPVHAVAHALGLGEVQACRAVRDAVEAGLVVVTEVAPVAVAPATLAPPTAGAPAAVPSLYGDDGVEFEGFEIELPPIKMPDEALPPPPSPAPAWRFDPFEQSWDEPNGAGDGGPALDAPAEDAAPAEETGDGEDAAESQVDEELPQDVPEEPEQPIDRGRLLRFLGSVRS